MPCRCRRRLRQRVPACGRGEPLGLGQGSGQVGAQDVGFGAQFGGLGLEGGDAPDAALPPCLLALRVSLRYSWRAAALGS
jgi:hypothetical protein